MNEISELLALSTRAAAGAARRLRDASPALKDYVHDATHEREIKAAADAALEDDIVRALAPAGIPILSEESGYRPGDQASPYRFIVDPLDGTFNYVKSLGPSAVAIALWQGDEPVFGVIHGIGDDEAVWGGPGLGAYAGDRAITVSVTATPDKASLCTGFPVRFDLLDAEATSGFWRLARCYAKVRMFGCASMSLVRVANGSADAYAEQNIMLWDVAAGLAIVQGAGGRTHVAPTATPYAVDVYASNASLFRLAVA